MIGAGSIEKCARLLGMSAALVAAGVRPAVAQQLGGARPLEIPYLQIGAGLILCSLAAFAAVLVLQRRAGRTPGVKLQLPWHAQGVTAKRPLKVLESQRLSPHADVCRFVAYDREYVVIVTANAINIVGERSLPDEHAAQGSSGDAA